MPLSEWLLYLHWIIYIGSVVSFIALTTRFRVWGAIWIAILFASQGIFRGCILNDLQNYVRVHEGLPPLHQEMLTSPFTDSPMLQVILSFVVAFMALVIAYESLHQQDRSRLQFIKK